MTAGGLASRCCGEASSSHSEPEHRGDTVQRPQLIHMRQCCFTYTLSSLPCSGPHCVAVFQFAAAGADELSLAVGDTVELVGRVGGEWLRGRLGGQEGIFPAQFVEVKVDLPAEPVGGEKGEAKGSWSKATFDFAGQEGELSFKVRVCCTGVCMCIPGLLSPCPQAGARIKLLCRVNEDWVEGATEEGAVGIFPASFVDNLPPDLPAKSDTAEATPVKVCMSVDFVAL